MAKLTQKQELFCNYYVECGGNASEAYRMAFSCGKMKDKTVWERASVLLNEDKVTTRVNELQAELKAKSDLTKERVLQELEAIIDAKITDYVDLITVTKTYPQSVEEIALGASPQTYEVQELVFKDFSLLTKRQVRAIESIKQGRNGIELKLHGKSWTIDRICKMLGYDAPQKVEHSGEVDIVEINYK